MIRPIGIGALAAVIAALTLASVAAAKPPVAPENVRGAFFTNWSRYARGYTVKQIPADQLNVIDYAFAFITPGGACSSSDPWSDYQAPTWSGTDSVDGVADDPSNPDQHLFGNFNQLREAEGCASEPPPRDLDRRLDGLDVLLRRRSDRRRRARHSSARASTSSSRAICRPAAGRSRRAAPARRPGSSTASTSTGSSRASIPATARTTRRPTARNATAAPAGVPSPARRARQGRRAGTISLTNDIPGGNIHSTGSWELQEVAQDRRLDRPDVVRLPRRLGADGRTSTRRSCAIPRRRRSGGGAIESTLEHGGLGRSTSSRTACPRSKLVARHPVLRQGVRRRSGSE